tara:strand:+ start:15383 stop:17287 length:1905 start_codon:yes stop_codon:yes gene_type:complete
MTGYIYKTDASNSQDIEAYLQAHQHKSLLRFITCGSVDDGKSTLIGRLLYESKMIFEDQLEQLSADSKTKGTQNGNIDFALLLDGLAAEREQGITIDVAYRFFSTDKRKFIVADTPGHEQYTRNMVTGASTADLAVILVDVCKGVLTQTRRHSYLVKLVGVKNIVLAVNKMDLVDYDQEAFEKISSGYRAFAKEIGIEEFSAVPISATNGENITKCSEKTSWYSGPSILEILENVNLEQSKAQEDAFCMPVQWVNRPNSDFRGFAGKIVSGSLVPGDKVSILPSGKITAVSKIVSFEGPKNKAFSGQSVTLTLKDQVDCSRGQMITAAENFLQVADQFETTMIWLDEEALMPGRSYYLKIGPQLVTAVVSEPKYEINVNSLEHIAAKTFKLNSIGVATVTVDRAVPFAPYHKNRELGGFILIDQVTNSTVGAGLIKFALRRSQNIHWQELDVDRENRAKIKNQKPRVAWLTGLSGSGKTTIANAVEKKLANMGRHTFFLDGDNMRHGLNKDLGFTDADRIENIRRVGEVAKLMTDAGLIVIAAFISPFRAERRMVREMIKPGEFIEVFIDTPLSIAEARDVKGLYAKARSGELKNFTGIDSPYEKPHCPEIRIDTTRIDIEEAAEKIIKILLKT